MGFEFNLKTEKDFLALLGLELVPTSYEKCWAIMDENMTYVGDVHKNYGSTRDGGFCTFYKMSLKSDKIQVNSVRKDDAKDYTFVVDVLTHPGIKLYIRLGSEPQILIAENQKEVGHLKVNDERIDLSYHMVIPDEYDVVVSMLYQEPSEQYDDLRGNKSYVYKLEYRDLKETLNKHKFFYEWGFTEVDNETVRFLTSIKTVRNYFGKQSNKLLNGTVEEAFKKDEAGVNSLMYFRNCLKNYYPIKEDIVSMMLENSQVGRNLNVFRNQKNYRK